MLSWRSPIHLGDAGDNAGGDCSRQVQREPVGDPGCRGNARGGRGGAEASVDLVPMADGGEGTVDALVAATGGSARQTQVSGPLGESVTAGSACWATVTPP